MMIMMRSTTRFLSILLLLFLIAYEPIGTHAFNVRPLVRTVPTHTHASLFYQSSSWNNNHKISLNLSSQQQQQQQQQQQDTVILDRDFRVAGMFLLGAVGLAQIPILKFVLAPLAALLGILFLVQTFRLQFVCDETSFALLNTSLESGENILVGGQNRWTYDSFVNYEFFPRGWIDQPQGPILIYFKETQTPSDKWQKGPGAAANSAQAKENGAIPGQAHFFPAVCNAQQLRAEWQRRGCSKLME